MYSGFFLHKDRTNANIGANKNDLNNLFHNGCQTNEV